MFLGFLILTLFFHLIHSQITRTPKELQRAMINNAPWSQSKHYRFDPQFQRLVFELLCVQQSLAIPLEIMEGIVSEWSMVRKFNMAIGENEENEDNEEDDEEDDDEDGEDDDDEDGDL